MPVTVRCLPDAIQKILSALLFYQMCRCLSIWKWHSVWFSVWFVSGFHCGGGARCRRCELRCFRQIAKYTFCVHIPFLHSRQSIPHFRSVLFGEGYCVVYLYFVLLEILRFAQDDKLGFVGIILYGRARACPRRGVRCKLTAGASPRPTCTNPVRAKYIKKPPMLYASTVDFQFLKT